MGDSGKWVLNSSGSEISLSESMQLIPCIPAFPATWLFS